MLVQWNNSTIGSKNSVFPTHRCGPQLKYPFYSNSYYTHTQLKLGSNTFFNTDVTFWLFSILFFWLEFLKCGLWPTNLLNSIRSQDQIFERDILFHFVLLTLLYLHVSLTINGVLKITNCFIQKSSENICITSRFVPFMNSLGGIPLSWCWWIIGISPPKAKLVPISHTKLNSNGQQT